MANKKETAVPNVSGATDMEQPIQKFSSNSITPKTAKFNIFVKKAVTVLLSIKRYLAVTYFLW